MRRKATINLLPRKPRIREPKKLVRYLLAAVPLLALALTFGVLRPLQKQAEARLALQEVSARLEEATAANADYTATAAAYEATASQRFQSPEELLPDRLTLLGLAERVVLPRCTLLSLQIEGSMMHLRVSGLDLEEAGALIRLLAEEELVESASVSGAGGAGEPMTLAVTLRSEEASR